MDDELQDGSGLDLNDLFFEGIEGVGDKEIDPEVDEEE